MERPPGLLCQWSAAALPGAASTLLLVAAVAALAASCAGQRLPAERPATARACADHALAPVVSAPAAPPCDNAELAGYSALLVLAPHPDDEVLGFAGLIAAYLEQGKPATVVVATDGDAYCEACRFWKGSSVGGATCGAEELSNFATPAIDSFAELRRAESAAAMAILGAAAPEFLGYPDTGLAAAWSNHEAGAAGEPLRRSDFAGCPDCESCGAGYGGGPPTELTAETLEAELAARIAAVPEDALIATTHWLDGHGDHAALGHFVRRLNARLEAPRAAAYAVIHAHTPKETPHPDCWYPAPAGVACPCADESCARADPGWIAALRAHRLRPEWPARLPDDADYGAESQLCLAPELYRGAGARKLAAVNAYASQLGFAARRGEPPPALAGILDCSGYLVSFVRRTEAFVLLAPER